MNFLGVGDFIEARAMRPRGAPMHGVTTTQSVFWNTRGPAQAVDSSDFVEGVGTGDSLQPRPFYLGQLSRRLGHRSP